MYLCCSLIWDHKHTGINLERQNPNANDMPVVPCWSALRSASRQASLTLSGIHCTSARLVLSLLTLSFSCLMPCWLSISQPEMLPGSVGYLGMPRTTMSVMLKMSATMMSGICGLVAITERGCIFRDGFGWHAPRAGETQLGRRGSAAIWAGAAGGSWQGM